MSDRSVLLSVNTDTDHSLLPRYTLETYYMHALDGIFQLTI